MHRIFNNSSRQKCCSNGHLTLNGGFERRIRISLGEFKMDFWRVRCSMCGKTFASFAKFIGWGRYQTESKELEKLVIEAVSGTNYRKTLNDLERDGKSSGIVPHCSRMGNKEIFFLWLQKRERL